MTQWHKFSTLFLFIKHWLRTTKVGHLIRKIIYYSIYYGCKRRQLRYCITFVSLIVCIFWRCVFLFVFVWVPQYSVCMSFQKSFSFHLGLELSYFPHYFPRKCGNNLHTGEIENNTEELKCQLTQRGALIVF